MVSRNTAYRLWISDINSSKYTKSFGEFESNYIEFKDKRVSRVNIISTVINKYETDTYSSLLIDDGSSQISLKAWNIDKKIIDKANIGDVMLVVGKIRQNNLNTSLYIQPEIIKKIDEKWLLARKKELEKEYGAPAIVESNQDIKKDELKIEEVKVSNESVRTQILNLIDKLDNDEGVLKDKILNSINSSKTQEAIEELLREGEIFEINGRYKLLK
jgi:RPA family protein